MGFENNIIQRDDPLLITGANGFIGNRVVATFAQNGFTNIRCLVRESSNIDNLLKIKAEFSTADISLPRGNLLSKALCRELTQGVKLVVHLAAGRGGKSYSVSFLNSVVTSKNLLESLKYNEHLVRFLNVSSFTVYANRRSKPGALLDESSEVESYPLRRGEPYCYSKVHQEKILRHFAEKYAIPVVNVRPGAVYGPGNSAITGRVGVDTFGVFLHFGGQNQIPLSYVDNCAYAIYKCSLAPGIDGEDFNIVDSDLPTSRDFLDLYKVNVRNFRSLHVPKALSYLFCFVWEKYSQVSKNQLPPVFNRYRWHANWKGNTYTNRKLSNLADWHQVVSSASGFQLYFDYCKSQIEKVA